MRLKLNLLAVALVGLNLFDAAMTLRFLREWVNVYESTPWMASLLASSPDLFVAVKLAVPAAGGAVCVVQGGRRGLAALAFAVAVYSGIACYHLWVWSL